VGSNGHTDNEQSKVKVDGKAAQLTIDLAEEQPPDTAEQAHHTRCHTRLRHRTTQRAGDPERGVRPHDLNQHECRHTSKSIDENHRGKVALLRRGVRLFLLGFHFFVYRPLRQITEAAKQYAMGNLDYEIPVHTHDEMGYLSASLNYMSVQIKDMDDYQKKIVANVSHDFRSPLTSIKGYVEAMTDGTIPPELHEKYLKIILFETERLTDLTTDLLTLNEFDTKELLLDKSQFDIQEVIKNTAQSFEGVCTPKHISIKLILLPGTVKVNADKRKIQQVLYNLIDNAIKFSENDSSISVEVTEKNGTIFVSVKDHGIGIPKKELNKIWERFYKSDLSRGKDKKGTGLGLSIVKEVIQAHDEHINVISTEGVGTEFIFSLTKVTP